MTIVLILCKGLQAYAAVVQRPQRLAEAPQLYILHGPSNVHKSRSVRERFGDALYEVRLPDHLEPLRWDGYNQNVHHAVLLDDWAASGEKWRFMPSVQQLNNWIDWYPFWGRTFGGQIQIRPRIFIITAQRSPSEWWNGQVFGTPEFDAFWRRVTKSAYVDSVAAVQRFWAEVDLNQQAVNNPDAGDRLNQGGGGEGDQEAQAEGGDGGGDLQPIELDELLAMSQGIDWDACI